LSAVKCVIWDLDNTLWDGVCLEDSEVSLKPGIREVLEAIHSRGIVQSIASKNEPSALDFVKQFGLSDFFVFPQVNWEPKEHNIQVIAERLNLGLDAVAFVDDNPFELESVAQLCPGVRTYSAEQYQTLPAAPEMQMKYDTEESRARGQMYVDEAQRQNLEGSFKGRKQEFMRSLKMVATLRLAIEEDLPRISELVSRTNQFNSTGIRYSDEEIADFFRRSDHTFHVVSLVDRLEPRIWAIEILLLSCRVAGRGLGTAFLAYLAERAREAGCQELRAKYIRTDRNRQIGLLYKIVGFTRDADASDETASVFTFAVDQGSTPFPDWIELAASLTDGDPS
jgi:FkbH-like protein